MNRPIKFRGRRLDGSFVYGDLIHYRNGTVAIQIIEGGIYPVIGDTVAQLVGYDKNGNEVYEGDTLIDELEQEYIARIYDPPQCIAALTLKEQSS